MIMFLKNFWNEESGQDLVEYALVLGLIALIAVTALTATGGSIKSIWGAAQTKTAAAAAEAAK